MSFFNDQKTLISRLVTELGSSHPTLVLLKPNEVKDLQEDLWARVDVRPGETRLVGMGTPARYRNTGVVLVSLFGKPDKGHGPVLTLGDDVAAIYRRWTSGNLRARAPSIQDEGLSGSWYRVNVLIPYQSDHFY